MNHNKPIYRNGRFQVIAPLTLIKIVEIGSGRVMYVHIDGDISAAIDTCDEMAESLRGEEMAA